MQTCKRCLMDTTASGITFDKKGFCNFCEDFLNYNDTFHNGESLINHKESLIHSIKEKGKGKPYDCIIGISGGVDSSYALHLAVEEGLRPLAVHMDNGWNAELATNNISNLINRLGVDLKTHVINWEEYRGLMECFLKANVIDIELLYDNAMLAVNYQAAIDQKIGYILSGNNTATEGVKIPTNWNWLKYDKKNILDINKAFGGKKTKTMPMLSVLDYCYARYIRKIKWSPFLDYFEYNKGEALTILKEKYDYKPYPYKHYESVFTRLYQGYILPQKFNVDKRKAHLSSLICSNQMTREDGEKELEKIPYHSQEVLDEDINYFIKKMNWTSQQLEAYLNAPEVPHDHFKSEKKLFDFLLNLKQKLNN